MSNFDIARAAKMESENAEGSATAELAKYQESIQGRMQSMKASWQDFSMTMMNSGLIKGGVSAMGGILDGLTGMTKSMGTLGSVAMGVGIQQLIKGNPFKGLVSAFTDPKYSVGEGIKLAGMSLTDFATSIPGVITGISAVVAAGAYMYNKAKVQKEDYEAGLQKDIDKIDAYQESYEKLEDAYIAYSDRAKSGKITVGETKDFQNILSRTIKASDITGTQSKEYADSLIKSYGDINASMDAIMTYQNGISKGLAQESIGLTLRKAQSLNKTVTGMDRQLIFNKNGVGLFDESIDSRLLQLYKDNPGMRINTTSPMGNSSSTGLQIRTDSAQNFMNDYAKLVAEKEFIEQSGHWKTENGKDYMHTDKKGYKELAEEIGRFDDTWNQLTEDRFKEAKAQYQLVHGVATNSRQQMAMVNNMLNNLGETSQMERDRVVALAKEDFGAQFMFDWDAQKSLRDEKARGTRISSARKYLDTRGSKEINDYFNSLSEEAQDEASKVIIRSGGDAARSMGWFKQEQALINAGMDTTKESMNKFIDAMAVGDKQGLSQQLQDYTKGIANLNKAQLGLATTGLSALDRLAMSADMPEELTSKLLGNNKDFQEGLRIARAQQTQDMINSIQNQRDKLDNKSPYADALFQNQIDAIKRQERMAQVFDMPEETAKFTNMQTAIKESLGATGMTLDSYKSLNNMFSELSSYDPAQLFESTALGMRVNSSALNDLNNQYSKMKVNKLSDEIGYLNKQLSSSNDELRTLTKENDPTTIFKRDALKTSIRGMEEEIANAKAMMTIFSTMDNEYSRWAQTQDDKYQDVGSNWAGAFGGGYKNMEKALNDKMLGTNAVRTYMDMFSSKDLSKASPSAILAEWEKFDDTIAGTSYSLKSFTDESRNGYQGLENFGYAMQELYPNAVKLNETTGSFDFDFDGRNIQELADKFGVSAEAMQLLIDGSVRWGSELKGLNTNPLTATVGAFDEIRKAQEEVIMAGGVPVEFNVDLSNIEQVRSKLEEVKNTAQSLREKRSSQGFLDDLDTAKLGEAEAQIKQLVVAKQELSRPAFMDIDTSKLEAGTGTAIKALQELQGLVNEREMNINLGLSTEEVDGKIEALASKIHGLDPEIKAKLGIDESWSVQDIINAVTNGTIELPAEVVAEVEEARARIQSLNSEKVQVVVEATVKGFQEGGIVGGVQGAVEGAWSTFKNFVSDNAPQGAPAPQVIEAQVKVTGKEQIDQIKSAIDGLKTTNVEVTVDVNGGEKVDEVKNKTEALPPEKKTNVNVDVSGGERIESAEEALNNLPDEKRTNWIASADTSGLGGFKSELDELPSERVVKIRTQLDRSDIHDNFDRRNGGGGSDESQTIKVNVEVEGAEKVQEVQSALLAIYDRHVVMDVAVSGNDQVKEVQESLLAIYDRGVVLTITTSGEDTVQEVQDSLLAIYDRTVLLQVSTTGAEQVSMLQSQLLALYDRGIVVTCSVSGVESVLALYSALVSLYDRHVQANCNVTGTSEVYALIGAIGALYSKTVSVGAEVYGTGSVYALAGAIGSVYSKSVTISVTTVYSTIGSPSGHNAGTVGNMSFASGTAYAEGTTDTFAGRPLSSYGKVKKGGLSLVGELGEELVVFREATLYSDVYVKLIELLENRKTKYTTT